MFDWHGTRLYGRVDEVPGVFYVSTDWYHVNLVPYYPLTSVVVSCRPRGAAQPRPIGNSAKSIWLVRFRIALILFGLLCWAFAQAHRFRPEPTAQERFWGGLITLTAAAILFAGTFSPLVRRASPSRARELARIVGFSEADAEEIGRIAKSHRWSLFPRRPKKSTHSATDVGVRWRETPPSDDRGHGKDR